MVTRWKKQPQLRFLEQAKWSDFTSLLTGVHHAAPSPQNWLSGITKSRADQMPKILTSSSSVRTVTKEALENISTKCHGMQLASAIKLLRYLTVSEEI